MRVIRENSCMLKTQPLRTLPEKEMFLNFINKEIVEKLKYTNGSESITSLKSELLHRYLLFLFFAGTSILRKMMSLL